MSKVFFIGFFWFVTSTIAFIIAILNPYWIMKTNPDARGIFETCDIIGTLRNCQYILLSADNPTIQERRTGLLNNHTFLFKKYNSE
jgi:hypothetical protein